MKRYTFFLTLALAILALVDIIGSVCVRPKTNLKPEHLQGTWFLLKWKPPPSFPVSSASSHYTQYWKHDYATKRFDVKRSGRNRTPPYRCFERPATLTPYSQPGFYKWRSSGPLGISDAVIVDTDYFTYLAIMLCRPKLRPGCEMRANVFTRSKTPGPGLVNFLDRLIIQRLCLNPRTFFFTFVESRGIPRCPKPRDF